MSDQPSPEQAQPAGIKLVVGAVIATFLLAALGQTIITPALPIIVADLGGIEHISWAFTAFLLATTISAPVYGKLGDMFGRKIMLQSGIAIFLVGSIACALSWDLYSLVAFRFVQGIGGGGLIVTAMAAFADVLPPRERGKAQGFVGAAFGVSTVIGPLLGGVIVDLLSWRWLFLVNLPIGIFAFAIIALAFETRQSTEKRQIDYLGAIFLAAILGSSVIYASIGGTVVDWLAPQALILPLIALLSLIGFILAERKAAEPILPLFLFRNNAFVVSNAVGFITGTVMFGTITFLPSYLLIVKGLSPTQAGLGLLPMMIGLIVTSMISGSIMARTGRYKFLPIMASLALALGALLMGSVDVDTDLTFVMLYALLIGMGIGPVISIGVSAIQNAVPPEVLGVGTASANMFRQIGGSLGVAVLGAIFANRLTAQLGDAGNGSTPDFEIQALAALPDAVRLEMITGYAHALQPVFLVCVGFALTAFAVAWLLREQPLSDTKPSQGDPEATQPAK